MLDTYSQNTRPLWYDTSTIKKYPEATSQVTVDVCIIGGGIAGLTAADILKRAGKTVAIVELGRIGCGETGHTTAHLTEVLDLDYRDLISRFGLEGAKLATSSVRGAIDRIEENAKRKGIDCGFERLVGFQYTEKESQADELEDEAKAAIRAGVANQLVFEAPLPFKIARGIRFENQAQFHPLRYLAGLAEGIDGQGSYIFEETRMLDVADGEPCKVTTDHGTITADDVIIAAHVPTNRLLLQTKIAAYRTYAIAAEVNPTFDAKHLYWDIDDPYHYIRSFDSNGKRYLIIGGEDHKTGKDTHTGVHFQKLEDFANAHFDVERFTHRWSGQIVEPVDGLPYIGRNSFSDHVYVATGFSGNGLTFGTVAGMLTSDLILGVETPLEELYDAGRVKPLASIGNYLKENVDFPSHMISDRFTHSDQKSETQTLRENEGAIVNVGGKTVAAYRDPQGELHVMSPACPHMGCYVAWNEAETSWDCPCHGSRFSPVGRLLNGPAVSDLASESYDENAPMIPARYEQPGQTQEGFTPPLLTMFSCPCKAQQS